MTDGLTHTSRWRTCEHWEAAPGPGQRRAAMTMCRKGTDGGAARPFALGDRSLCAAGWYLRRCGRACGTRGRPAGPGVMWWTRHKAVILGGGRGRPGQLGGRRVAGVARRREGETGVGGALALAHRRAVALAVHRRTGALAEPGAGCEDRQHRERAAADRARPTRTSCTCSRSRAGSAGSWRSSPPHYPAGCRAGAQRPRGRPGTAASVRAARLRLLGGHGHAAALHSADRADRGPLRRHQQRVLPGQQPDRARTTCTPTRGSCSTQAPHASKARDIGFRFGPPPPGGKTTRSASVSYPAASFTFAWSAAKNRWLVSMDGARAVTTDGGRLAPATVVIQHTTVRHVPVPGVRQAPAVRGERRVGDRAGPARRQRVDHTLVPAVGQRRHHVHQRVRPADDLRPRPGLDRAGLPVTRSRQPTSRADSR